jgi:ABC-type uncharacterized transport system permease subunit
MGFGFGGTMKVWYLSDTALTVLLIVPAIAALIHVWMRPKVALGRRIKWTLVLMIPVLGPLFYGALFHPLRPHTSSTEPGSPRLGH